MEVTNLVQVQNFLIALFRPIIQEAINESILDLSKNSSPQFPTEIWFDLNGLVDYDPEKRTKPTFYGYMHRREIPFHKRGRKCIFLKSEIDDWLKQGRKKTLAETTIEADNYLLRRKKRGSHE